MPLPIRREGRLGDGDLVKGASDRKMRGLDASETKVFSLSLKATATSRGESSGCDRPHA